MKKLSCCLSVLIIALPFAAHAGASSAFKPFGEVYAGADSSSIDAETLTSTSEDAKTSGLVGGFRGGSRFSVLMVGADVQGTLNRIDFADSSSQDGTWTRTPVFLFGGFDFDRLRLWSSIAVTNESNLNQTVGTFTFKTKIFGGTHFKYGASVRLFKGLHVNAEYYINRPAKVQAPAATVATDLSSTHSKWQETGMMFTLSWVFDTGKAK